jgi:ribosome-associated protein
MRIPERELIFSYARSGGKGGQNVNKVNTKVVLLWYPAASSVFSAAEKARLFASPLMQARLNQDGAVVIHDESTRSQDQNRSYAIDRLDELVERALRVPKRRVPTRPGRGAKERRLKGKQRQKVRKQERKKYEDD